MFQVARVHIDHVFQLYQRLPSGSVIGQYELRTSLAKKIAKNGREPYNCVEAWRIGLKVRRPPIPILPGRPVMLPPRHPYRDRDHRHDVFTDIVKRVGCSAATIPKDRCRGRFLSSCHASCSLNTGQKMSQIPPVGRGKHAQKLEDGAMDG